MSTVTKFVTQVAMALVLVIGVSVSASQPAEAGSRGGRIAAGIVLGVIGTAIIASEIDRAERRRARRWSRHRARRYRRRHHYYYSDYSPRIVSCYRGPKRCRWVGRRECWYNRYDERVCTGGRYKCWRPRICD